MKYDTIIIGGGMSGLITGICLLRAGQSVAIVSSGHSALHFNSGSMGLLGNDGENTVSSPLKSIENLPSVHPYSKIGLARLIKLLPSVKGIFAEAGIAMQGDETANHYRLSPLGEFRPAWLTMAGYVALPAPAFDSKGIKLIVNIKGFIDFYPDFISRRLVGPDTKCVVREITHPLIEDLRKNSTEMRASNIARLITGEAISEIANSINELVAETRANTVIMPGVFGCLAEDTAERLRSLVWVPMHYIATIPASVCGSVAQMRFQHHFSSLGGDYLLGDTVISGSFDNGSLQSVTTSNLGDTHLRADNFVIATGSFISHGLISTPEKMYEPLFGLDLTAPSDPQKWCNIDIYANHPYMTAGVETDSEFHTKKDGCIIPNLYAVGSIIGGCNPIKEDSGGGIAILTAMAVTENIIKKSTLKKDNQSCSTTQAIQA